MMWDTIKLALRQVLPENEHGLWIEPICCEEVGEHNITLSAPDRFFCSWVEDHYLELIQNTAEQVAGTQVTVNFLVSGNGEPTTAGPSRGQLRLPGTTPVVNRIRSLHPGYTFGRFMVGESNILARSACDSLARGDKTYGNFLFMNSGTGLGKSHLTQAVVRTVLDTAPSTRLNYLTAQQFTAEMVNSLKNRTMDKFSRKYVKNCDMLLVEDVHTLVGKNKTQEELNMVLDYLIKSGRRVILTSAVPPRKLEGLDDDFRSRMTSGLVAGIEAPDYGTRVKIICNKAVASNLELSDELVDYLARYLKGDIRKTESVLLGIRAKSCLLKTKPDMDMIKDALSNLMEMPRQLDGKAIRELISCQYNVSVDALTSRSRKKTITFPRQVAMYLTRKYTDHSLADIGAFYNRDHSTVLYAIKVVTRESSRKNGVREQIDILSRKLTKE
jgi:chromosomal replication initiator protein